MLLRGSQGTLIDAAKSEHELKSWRHRTKR